MSATIRIKRTTTSNRPASLKNAEMAFIEGSGILVIGTGTSGENAASIIDIGGTGAFLGLSNSLTQTAAGAYTFSGTATFTGTTSLGAATATSPSTNDDSTRVATTEWVKDQGYATTSGTVTSVALSLPNIFTVSGSPVTSTGTLSASLSNQNANLIFAGPSSGSAAAPTFRSLASGDIPDISGTYLTVSTASSTYLSQSSASSTYLTQSSAASTYLPQSTASATYLSQADATSTYLPASTAASTYASLAGASAQTISRDTTLSGTVNLSGTIQIGGTGMTSSAAELNLVDGSVANTVVNSKAVIYGSAGEIAASSISTTGNVTVGGNLTVNGTTTTINSTSVSVDDINVILGDTASPSDATADGGGITLKGTTDKTLNWVSATSSWTSSENMELASGKAFRINGASVLSGSTLGSGVTASSLTSVGTLTSGALGTGFTAVGVAQGGTGLTSAVSGLLKGAAGSYSAATAGTDYLAPDSTIDGGSYS